MQNGDFSCVWMVTMGHGSLGFSLVGDLVDGSLDLGVRSSEVVFYRLYLAGQFIHQRDA